MRSDKKVDCTKIIHIVCFYSNENPFGGPSSVALAMVRKLSANGYSAVLRAGTPWRKNKHISENVNLYRTLRILPNKKFSGLIAFGLFLSIFKDPKRATLYHIHLGRDLISMLFAFMLLLTGRRYIVQTHGMVSPSTKLSVQLLDAFFIRAILKGARFVLYLTDLEAERLRSIQTCNLLRYPNSISKFEVLATSVTRDIVLFAGRMHVDKNPLPFITAAHELSLKFPDIEFQLVGSDGGELDKVKNLLLSTGNTKIKYIGIRSRSELDQILMKTLVVVVPSKADVFPRIILEAIASNSAVILSKMCQVSNEFYSNGAVTLCSIDSNSIYESAIELITNKRKRDFQIANARKYVETNYNFEFWMDVLLDDVYEFTR